MKINPFRFLECIVSVFLVSGLAQAQSSPDSSAQACPNDTFTCLHPEFLKTLITPAYSQYESATSPATYNAANNDFISQFTSPSGKQVTVVVKSPVTTKVYDVPPIASNQSVYDYLNNALYNSSGNPRSKTYIKFPKATYNFNFPLHSNCNSTGVHWQLPTGATDLVIDGQGSTVNFSDFCTGLNLTNVNRVVLKNFTFQWPNIQIASVGTITAAGGNGNTGYTYDVHFDPIAFGPQPDNIAATTLWDKAANHYSLINWGQYDVSYGDGVSSGSQAGAPVKCIETPEEQKTKGCTVKGVPSFSTAFKEGQLVLLRFYSFGTAISISGQDITLDTVTLKNLIGSDFSYSQGRGLHVTHLTLTRMANQPVSATGGGSLLTAGVTGDIAIDNSSIGYQSDDAFDMNIPMLRFEPPADVKNYSTAMPTIAFNKSIPDQLQWPLGYGAGQKGDIIAIFDSAQNLQDVMKILSVRTLNSNTIIVTLDHDVAPSLADDGFIVADLTGSSAARYVINNNTFQYNRARALLLQTPFGWVHDNHFVGQTMRGVYVLDSLYWGEGLGAQDLTISNNLFDDTWHQGDYLPLDILAEAPDFPNIQDEVTNIHSTAPSVNQNIIVANNTFISDRITAVVNLSSVNNAVFSGNNFELTPNLQSNTGDQFPISVHDASNIYFDDKNEYSADWLSKGSCTYSRLLSLNNPPAKVSAYLPAACGIEATTSNLTMAPAADQ